MCQRYAGIGIATAAKLVAFAICLALPAQAKNAGLLESSPPIRLADNTVRKEPKEKKPDKQDIPALPPSAIPGAKNPVENKPTTPPADKDKKTPTVNLPRTGPDHCDGSPNCSKQFDGGKSGK